MLEPIAFTDEAFMSEEEWQEYQEHIALIAKAMENESETEENEVE